MSSAWCFTKSNAEALLETAILEKIDKKTTKKTKNIRNKNVPRIQNKNASYIIELTIHIFGPHT